MEKKLFVKRIYKGMLPFVLTVLLMTFTFQSCQKDELLTGIDPESGLNQDGQLKSASITAAGIDLMIQRIAGYLSEGTLESGLANAFTVKLENAGKSLEKGNEEASVNQVHALLNQVEGLMNAGKIDTLTGEEIIFYLKVLVGENPTYTDPRDNHVYKTIKIGNQVWLAENLAYKAATGCYFYGGDLEYEDYAVGIFGRLYNWDAAVAACPPGWHLPTDAEWTELANFLIDNGYGYGGSGDDIAKALADTEYWKELVSAPGDINAKPGYNMLTNNSSGFSGRAGGGMGYNGEFGFIGETALWWSATEENNLLSAWQLYYASDTFSCWDDINNKGYGFSVRCIRD